MPQLTFSSRVNLNHFSIPAGTCISISKVKHEHIVRTAGQFHWYAPERVPIFYSAINHGYIYKWWSVMVNFYLSYHWI